MPVLIYQDLRTQKDRPERKRMVNTRIRNYKNHKNGVFATTSFYRFWLLCIEENEWVRHKFKIATRVAIFNLSGFTHPEGSTRAQAQSP